MLATATTTIDPIAAHIIRGRLEAEGLHPNVAFEHHIRMNWFISTALGGVRVQVPPSEAEQAREVIQKINQNYYQDLLEEVEETRDDFCCPNCGSRNTRRSRLTEFLALIVLWFMILPIPFQTGAYVCQSCKHRWVSQAGKGMGVKLSLLAILTAWMFYLILEVLFYIACHVNQLSPGCY